jgi:hypothetical protein
MIRRPERGMFAAVSFSLPDLLVAVHFDASLSQLRICTTNMVVNMLGLLGELQPLAFQRKSPLGRSGADVVENIL